MSSAPAVLSALVTLGSAHLDADVQVIYGQPGTHTKARFFAAGWDEESPAVVQVITPTNAAMVNDSESYTVLSTLVSWAGEPDASEQVVADVYAMFAALESALERDRTLGGACTQARFSGVSCYPARTTKGPLARLVVSLEVINYP